MWWILAALVSLIAWALYWPVKWLEGPLVPIIVTSVAVVGVVVLYVVRRFAAKKAASALEQAILQQGSQQALSAKPERRAEIQALQQQMTQGIGTLKQSKLGGKKGAAALYSLPWYMIIGPPGAGKTTALKASGMQFPFSGADGGGVRGVGGTRNCDWWFTNEAILLDTAGRYTTESDDRDEWLAFLGMLKRYRTRRPINGVLVAISVADLIDANEQQIESYGKKIRGRIDEVMTQLQMVVPVYVLFTKVDLIAGFNEFYGDMKKSDRQQPWGATLRLNADKTNPAQIFETEFDEIIKRVHARAMKRITTERMREPREKIYQFPLEFAGIRKNLADFIGTTFAANSFQGTPIFRGFYFTSGTQEGRPLDRVLQRMGQVMGVRPPEQQQQQVLESKSYFLHDVFMNIVFRDADVAARSASEVRRQWLMRMAIAGAAAALAVIVCIPGVVSFFKNRSFLNETQERVEATQAIQWNQPPSKNLALLDPVLQRLLELDKYHEEGEPVGMGWMMYQGDRVTRPTVISYVAQLQAGFVVPCKQKLEERLKVVKGDKYLSERLDLKTYLMLNDSEAQFENLDVEWATGQYTALWFELVKPIADKPEADLKKQMTDHVRYYFTLVKLGRVTPVPLNKELVAYVRKVLMNVPIAKRYYDLYVTSVAEEKVVDAGDNSKANRLYPSVTLPEMFATRRDFQKYITSAMYEKDKKWREIEGPYTERGHYAVLRNIASGLGLLEQDAWVVPLGPDETKEKIAANINTLANEYEKKYIDAWQEFLADITVKSPATLQEAVDLYKFLADPPRPFFVLLTQVHDHTQWPTAKSTLDAEWEKKGLKQVNRVLKDRFRQKTGLVYEFDIQRMGDRQAELPTLFSKTVAFGVPINQKGGGQQGSLTTTPLAKYISRLDALRDEMQRLLDANDKQTPNVMQSRLVDAAKEVESLVTAQLMPVPNPKHKDPAPLLLPWLQNPLKVGTVRLPVPRLVPAGVAPVTGPRKPPGR
ncbi:MAG: type VI secretion system membrane subunit TssM [Polyangiaceae bacterium]|nr:type VI secretion system membrane subunit TssM [Polyangiaceae bacterium]